MNDETEIKVQLKQFPKTHLVLEIESIYDVVLNEYQIYSDVENTFYEYLFKESTTNITIVTPLLKPQIYKFANFQVKIEN